MAESMKAKITAMHVIVPASPHTVGAIRTRGAEPLRPEDYERVAHRRAEAVLAKVAAQAKAAKVPCTVTLVRHESPADAILDGARKSRCDVIVMATSGRKGIERFFLGSVASDVLKRSRVPVLVQR